MLGTGRKRMAPIFSSHSSVPTSPFSVLANPWLKKVFTKNESYRLFLTLIIVAFEWRVSTWTRRGFFHVGWKDLFLRIDFKNTPPNSIFQKKSFASQETVKMSHQCISQNQRKRQWFDFLTHGFTYNAELLGWNPRPEWVRKVSGWKPT